MRLIILKNDQGVSDWAAKYVIKRINEYNPSADKYVKKVSSPRICLHQRLNTSFRNPATSSWGCRRVALRSVCTPSWWLPIARERSHSR